MSKYNNALKLLDEWKEEFDKLVYADNGASSDAGFVQKVWTIRKDRTFDVNFFGHFSKPELDDRAQRLCDLYNYAMRNLGDEDDGNPVHDMEPKHLTENEWKKLDTDWGEKPDDEDPLMAKYHIPLAAKGIAEKLCHDDDEDDEDDWDTVYDSASDGWKSDWCKDRRDDNKFHLNGIIKRAEYEDYVDRFNHGIAREGKINNVLLAGEPIEDIPTEIHIDMSKIRPCNRSCVDKELYTVDEDGYVKKANDDGVNHPNHYNNGKYEVIDIIEDVLTPEEFKGFLKGNVIKYICRAGHKDDEIKDLCKCDWYLDDLIEKMKTTWNKLTNNK